MTVPRLWPHPVRMRVLQHLPLCMVLLHQAGVHKAMCLWMLRLSCCSSSLADDVPLQRASTAPEGPQDRAPSARPQLLLPALCAQPECTSCQAAAQRLTRQCPKFSCPDLLSGAHAEGDTTALWLQELYSKDTHFVLELVQNADDNAYAPGQLPALEFVLEEGRITVLNNEVCLPALLAEFLQALAKLCGSGDCQL